VESVLGSSATEGLEFCYPDDGQSEEAAIAETGLGVYLTVSGSTARDHGLSVGEHLFPSETVLLKSEPEVTDAAERVTDLLVTAETGTRLATH
jgi:ATP phosphoribosyltransferase